MFISVDPYLSAEYVTRGWIGERALELSIYNSHIGCFREVGDAPDRVTVVR